MQDKIKAFFEKIKNCNEIYISGHINPDGDSKATATALAFILKKLNIKPYILIEKSDKRFDFLRINDFVYDGDIKSLEPEILICVDCADKKRLGKNEEVFERAKYTVNIDHHISNTNYADLNIVMDLSSAGETLYNVCCDYVQMDTDIARAIYTAIASDTFSFKHNSTKPSTHIIASELIKYDIDYSLIHERLFYFHTLNEAKVLSKAIENMENDGDLFYSYLTIKQIGEIGATSEDLGSVISYMQNIDGCEISVFVTERGSNFSKISLRSNEFNVNEIASLFGGGGHIQAAGATNEENALITLEKVLGEIKKRR